jgi:transcriptional pleiotropic regulator of transition state genes
VDVAGGLAELERLEISVHGDTILLEKPHSVCVFCGSGQKLGEHRGRSVCRSCIRERCRA